MEKKLEVPSLKLASGNSIPVLGFGTYLIKGQACYQAVNDALEAGYTHIDTASIYANQEQIGKVLKKVDRKRLFITSKISPFQQGYQNAKTAFNNILQRLGTDYLDLLIIHWPGVSKTDVNSPKNSDIRKETWKALAQLKKEGKVRDIGVSNFLKHHLEDLIKNSQIKPAVNQFEIHPLLWQKSTIDYCRENKIVIQAYSPLARADERLLASKVITNLAEKYHKTPSQICLRWSLQHNFVVLPKSSKKNRIIENFNIFDFELTQSDMEAINKLSQMNVRVCWDPNAIKY